MSDLKSFQAAGAEVVAGSVILNRVTVGVLRNGHFLITPEGTEMLPTLAPKEATEAEAAPKPAKKAAKVKPEAPAADTLTGGTDLDDLLAQS